MNQINTKAIVLSRTNYGEADRIITVLTADYGKVRLIAKGVRKEKSKLAGGIELFCLNDITYIRGKNDLGTLISSRMDKSYGNIVKNLDYVRLGYDLIKLINKVTEDHTDESYFNLLSELLNSLNKGLDPKLISCWFQAQLLMFEGHSPNLSYDKDNDKLEASKKYIFDLTSMSLEKSNSGNLGANDIKVLRLLFGEHTPEVLNKVQDISGITKTILPIISGMTKTHLD